MPREIFRFVWANSVGGVTNVRPTGPTDRARRAGERGATATATTTATMSYGAAVPADAARADGFHGAARAGKDGRKIIVSGISAVALVACACAVRSSATGAIGARARLGQGSRAITLSAACSPSVGTFDPGDYSNVGARLVTKSMSSDFKFESALEMRSTGCGAWTVDAAIAPGEEFGFYLYPRGEEGSDEKTVLDIGCEKAGGEKCMPFASPAALSTRECTTPTVEGDLKFWNRRFDGSTTTYTWGACRSDCGLIEPTSCAAECLNPRSFDCNIDGGNIEREAQWEHRSWCGGDWGCCRGLSGKRICDGQSWEDVFRGKPPPKRTPGQCSNPVTFNCDIQGHEVEQTPWDRRPWCGNDWGCCRGLAGKQKCQGETWEGVWKSRGNKE